MVTYDVVERRTVDIRYVSGMRDPEAARPMPPVLFVSEERVVYEASGAVWSLDLGAHTVERLRGMSSDEVIDVGSDVTVVATSRVEDGKSGADSLGQLEFRGPGGSVRAEPSRLFREGRLSPDGRWFITSTGYEAGLRAVLLDTATGRQVPLDLPERMRGAYADPWGWSSPDVLMIELMTTGGPDDTEVDKELWACRVSAGTCESLPDAAPVLPW